MRPVLKLIGVSKTFTMHLQGGVRLPVLAGLTFSVQPGECVVLAGRSGIGKSSVLKMIFGSYRCDAGHILIEYGMAPIDLVRASPRHVLALRESTLGYVSQFLRAVPRVPAIDVVAEPLFGNGTPRDGARARAADLLHRLNIPGSLQALPPATFSGGEQQRVNIARGFLPERPILLLDEPTASLDAENCAVVMSLIAEKKKRGTAVVAVVHDEIVRERIADSVVDLTQFAAAA
jgi:alpha-D-ribose 1-methylphosphonate 5-triphosphate synthase subunit PhnL